MDRVVEPFAAPEFGAVGTGYRPLEGSALFNQLPLELGQQASTPITMRPAAVDESMPSVVEISVTPASVRALTVSRMWSVLRPSRSSFQTTTVSRHGRSPSVGQAGTVVPRTGHGVGERLDDAGGGKRGLLLIQGLGTDPDVSGPRDRDAGLPPGPQRVS